MTLGGALRDDKRAVEAGVFSILPEPDASGRPILYYSPLRIAGDYNTNSLVRLVQDQTHKTIGDRISHFLLASSLVLQNLSRSQLRAIWYVFEAVAEETNAEKGVIALSNWRPATLWDYDRKLEEGFVQMERCYMPFKFCAIYATGLPPSGRSLNEACSLCPANGQRGSCPCDPSS